MNGVWDEAIQTVCEQDHSEQVQQGCSRVAWQQAVHSFVNVSKLLPCLDSFNTETLNCRQALMTKSVRALRNGMGAILPPSWVATCASAREQRLGGRKP